MNLKIVCIDGCKVDSTTVTDITGLEIKQNICSDGMDNYVSIYLKTDNQIIENMDLDLDRTVFDDGSFGYHFLEELETSVSKRVDRWMTVFIGAYHTIFYVLDGYYTDWYCIEKYKEIYPEQEPLDIVKIRGAIEGAIDVLRKRGESDGSVS